MTQKFDVIIAGGGPAGASAAFFLGEAGRKVLVLEKESLPRYKPCGGAVSSRVLEQFPFSFEQVIRSRVKTISYAFGEKIITVPVQDPSLCMVMRSEFDTYMLSQVKAEIRPGTQVRSVEETDNAVAIATGEGERIEAEYLVAADGANSIIARALGLRRKKTMAGAIEMEASVPDEILKRHESNPILIFGGMAVGYIWIFPKADHLSIGVGGLHPKPGELQAALEVNMKKFGISIREPVQHGHPIPIYGKRETLGTSRCLLVGDAAGLVDPVTGEGIRFAIKSGRLAAEAILDGKPELYTKRVDQSIGRNHRLGNALTNLFYRNLNPWYRFVLRNPALSYGVVDMFADRIGYGRLLLRIVGSFPRFFLSKKVALEEQGKIPK